MYRTTGNILYSFYVGIQSSLQSFQLIDPMNISDLLQLVFPEEFSSMLQAGKTQSDACGFLTCAVAPRTLAMCLMPITQVGITQIHHAHILAQNHFYTGSPIQPFSSFKSQGFLSSAATQYDLSVTSPVNCTPCHPGLSSISHHSGSGSHGLTPGYPGDFQITSLGGEYCYCIL